MRVALLSLLVCLVLAGCTAAGTPGVGEQRVTDVDALATAHEAARGDAYVLVVNETTYAWLRPDEEPTVVRNEVTYRVDGDRTLEVRTQWRGRGTLELVTRGETFGSGTDGRRLARYSRGGRVRYAALSSGPPADPLVSGDLLVLERARVAGTVEGTDGAVLLRRTDDPVGDGEYGTETAAEAVVHRDGFVSSLHVEQTSVTPERRTLRVSTYRYLDRDDVTVQRPTWYDEAVAATRNRTG